MESESWRPEMWVVLLSWFPGLGAPFPTRKAQHLKAPFSFMTSPLGPLSCSVLSVIRTLPLLHSPLPKKGRAGSWEVMSEQA